MQRKKTKEYDMVKSVLPSRAAKAAKQAKDKLHRKNRRTSNKQCHMLAMTDVEYIDDIEDDIYYWAEPHRNYGWDYDIIYDRRGADHLNHFIVWAWLKTLHLPQQDKMTWLKSRCPMGLIGYHAMSHLEMSLGYDPVWNELYPDLDWHVPRRFKQRHFPRLTNEELQAVYYDDLVQMAYDGERRCRFNNHLRAQWERNKAYNLKYRTYMYTTSHMYSTDTAEVLRARYIRNYNRHNPLRLFGGKWDIDEYYNETKNTRNNWDQFRREE